MAPDITDTTSNNFTEIGNILNNTTLPLAERFRALFTLKNLGGSEAIDLISKGFHNPANGALLKHELAYCLGQMQDQLAIPILSEVLKDLNQEVMVRHEAGEALGAIGDQSALQILKEHLEDPVVEVAETCELALERLLWLESQKRCSETLSSNPFNSVDPAPPEPEASSKTTSELKSILVNESLPLFRRYRAMFELRNRGDADSVLALCDGLKCPKSALFRHEIAYVLGQMQHPDALPALTESLLKSSENDMVRHECAEAIGSVATPSAVDILKTHSEDEVEVVRESCAVALDMAEYEVSGELQYADTLAKVKAAC